MSYAYDCLGLYFVSPIGSADMNRRQWLYFQPAGGLALQQGSLFGLGGVQMGSALMTALLVSQADAVARGLAARGPGNG